MNRRIFIKGLISAALCLGNVPDAMAQLKDIFFHTDLLDRDRYIKDYLLKMKNFNHVHKDDIYVTDDEWSIFSSTVKRLRRLQNLLGHGNFQIVDFDAAVHFSRDHEEVGPFTRQELRFLEKLFYDEAKNYGFMGTKPLQNMTDRIDRRMVTKIPESGNFIFRGESLEKYREIRKQIGQDVILTSGVRGVMKQFLLFLNKAYANSGNLSLASRSLAPPGYSFHGNGDFDVGQIALGADNFTERFAQTSVYRQLCHLGYLKLRYPDNNLLGVRYEPWHVKVV